MKVIFGAMALITVLAGLCVYVFADALGLERELATMIAIVFLVVGAADFVIFKFADKIVATGRTRS